MRMETVEDMDKILAIVDAAVAQRKVPYDAKPRRTMAECYKLAENPEEYLALIAKEKAVTDAYFNSVQMQEWAGAHKRWIETGLDGYTSRELSPVGRKILANFINNLEVPCE
jgi:hypothetical protein